MIYGYARVSSADQNLDRQIAQLREFNNEIKIVEEKASGKTFNRPAYNELVHSQSGLGLRKDDLLVICSLDRLGRNYTEIKKEWEYITNTIQANIKVIDMPLLDTSNTVNNLDGRFIADLVLQILSYTAEKERDNIKKRQKQGIETAKANGKHLGRPNTNYPEKWKDTYTSWKSGSITATTAMVQLGLKRTTFYKLVKNYENSKK